MKAPVPMHIPDGFLSVAVSGILWVVSLIFIFIALKKAGKEIDESRLPLVGVLAAAIFAGQMLNFAVAGGTSGHLLGAALAVLLVGPWPAVLVMTSVVTVQALVFQDGGVLTLGANLFNMAIVGVAVAYFVSDLFKHWFGDKRWATLLTAFAAGWFSIFIAALAASLELAFSGTSPANIAIPAMGGIHALIGIGEGLITLGAVSLIMSSKPQLLEKKAEEKVGSSFVWISGLVLTVVLLIISPLASSKPDGLEWVAEKLGFLIMAQDASYHIIPDYVLPGIQNEALATIMAGAVGVVIVMALVLLLTRRKTSQTAKH
ncbi:energy-coupling factor ABC transporter permease [Pelolinea submarina]|uniref:Cobalt/nickel transport system permease protein n=1 Tax=Pelolinea submarina TaxID=913107 RepID=A0A3E0ABD7_9CHLR|nr:energy-coupling factor ABC transporter permease [Pelolinea submarina]REG05532.1 cobalt/nickel transport system permease protein [Pelolinea submarina]